MDGEAGTGVPNGVACGNGVGNGVACGWTGVATGNGVTGGVGKGVGLLTTGGVAWGDAGGRAVLFAAPVDGLLGLVLGVVGCWANIVTEAKRIPNHKKRPNELFNDPIRPTLECELRRWITSLAIRCSKAY